MIREIIESVKSEKVLKLYHGSNTKFSKIEPKYMRTDGSNMQEGVGIYFTTDLEVTKIYGKYVMEVDADLSKMEFLPSREFALDVYNLNDLKKLVKIIKIEDKDELYYAITDWVEVDYDASVNEMKEVFIENVLENFCDEEIRNVHIQFCEVFGTENFIEAWNKVFGKKFYGTYNEELQFYAIMDTSVKVNILK